MSDLLNININIAGNSYPMKVKPAEESKIRKAAQLINDDFNKYKKVYGSMKHIDLLAMTSLQIASDFIEINVGNNASNLKNEISKLNEELNEFIGNEKTIK